MLMVLIFFGAGAITFLLAEAASGKSPKNWYMALIEWFTYAILDHFFALVILVPTEKAAIITDAGGRQTVQFFMTGYAVFLFMAVFVGIVAAIAKKKFQVGIEIEPGKGVAADGKKKSR